MSNTETIPLTSKTPLNDLNSSFDSSSSSSSFEEEEEEEDVSMMAAPPFAVDECVFHWEHDRWYEAIVRKAEWKSGAWRFRLHFKGWNSRYDKWLPAAHIVKDTEESRTRFEQQQKRRDVQQQQASAKKRRKVSTTTTSAKAWLTLELPFTLKTILVEEYEHICGGRSMTRSVHSLPAAVTIRQVLNHLAKQRQDDEDVDTRRQFVKDMEDLFQNALPACLLYPQERPQYELYKNERAVTIYGCEFLLRLLLRLPLLLTTGVPTPPQNVWGPLLNELIVLLQKNRTTCFRGQYRPPRDNELLPYEQTTTTTKG